MEAVDRPKGWAVNWKAQFRQRNLRYSCINFTISDNDFLEVLLFQICGETIR